MSAFKQLVIRSLVDSKELQDEIMSFAFYDIETAEKIAESRRIKNVMINEMNRHVRYCLAPGSYWGLNYYSMNNNMTKKYVAIGGQIHNRCGNYYSLYSGEMIPRCVKCNCPEMVYEENEE